MKKTANIVIVEDNKILLKLMLNAFRKKNYQMDTFNLGEDFLNAAVFDDFISDTDVLILDVDLPDIDASEILKKLNAQQHSNLPYIIIYTNHTEQHYHLRFLELGADQFFDKSKGFEFLEVIIDNVMKAHKDNEVEDKSKLGFNKNRRQVFFRDKTEQLTKREAYIFEILWQYSGKYVSKKQLNVEALDFLPDSASRTADVHISNIRKKLANLDPEFSKIITSDNNGRYMFEGKE